MINMIEVAFAKPLQKVYIFIISLTNAKKK
jgi:hypothetical protein